MTVQVQSPMTAADHVTHLYLLSQRNPVTRMALFTLGPSRIMGGLLRQLEYVGCEEVVEAGGERHLGGLQLEYAATYRVTEGSPTEPV
mgnify:CR=1 FL=1